MGIFPENQTDSNMKKVVTALAIGLIGSIGYSYRLSQKITELKAAQTLQESHTEALDRLVHSLEYKRSAQLYLLCTKPNQETLQLLADSCKADCMKYKQSK